MPYQHRSLSRISSYSLLALGAALLVAGALLATTSRSSAQATDPFMFTLYGGNEVPPIASDATGTVSLELQDGQMVYHLQAEGAEFTQAHIHLGAAGANGGVVAFLLPMQDPPITEVDVSGIITVDDLIGDLEGNWDGFATAFLTDNLYVNIHSEANPSGELRGQADPLYCADLSGENETTPNDSDGTGAATINGSTGGIGYSLTVSGGTEAYTQAHIHQGAADEDGPVMAFLFNAGTGETATEISETGTVATGDLLGPAEDNLTGFLHYIAVSDAYVNVHSTEFPGGEIRGQLVHCSNVDAAAPPEPEPTATPTETMETETPEPTETMEPTATMVPPTNTPVPPTATAVAPGPPDTGTGTASTTYGPSILLMSLGLFIIAGGGATLALARRR